MSRGSAGESRRSEGHSAFGSLRYSEPLALLLITIAAAALRFFRLDHLPPGLHYDEAFNAVNARALLGGAPLQLFYASNMGQEPMVIYLVASAFGLLGQAAWVTRLPSAVVGTLTVPLCWWLGRELPALAQDPSHPRGEADSGSHRRFLGLGTALVLAILYWHLSFSRIGMEPILVPFFAVLALASLAHGLNKGHWPAFALAGAAVGGSLYTYKAGYLVPLLAALLVGTVAVVRHGLDRGQVRRLVLALSVFLLVAGPLGAYFATHPADFLHRPSSVVLSSGLVGEGQGTQEGLLSSLMRVLGMFFVHGDENPRSNLPGRPALDLFLALLFLVGLGRALAEVAHRRPREATMALAWLVLMTVPTLITEYPPHFARAIGATPAVALLCASGGWTTWNAARPRQAWRRLAALLLLLGVGFSAYSTARAYFVTWGRSPDLFPAYDVGLTELAGYLNTLPDDEQVYLTPTSHDHYTLQFLVRRTIASFDGREGSVWAPSDRSASIAVLLQEDQVTLPALQEARPDGSVAWQLADGWGRPYAVVYHLPGADSGPSGSSGPVPDHLLDLSFGGAARLLGYTVVPASAAPGTEVALTLHWSARAPLQQDYTVFTHLLGPYNQATDGPLWAGHDGRTDGGHYPTTSWRPGETILDVHRWSLPSDTPPGNYTIEVGLYLLDTMERLPVVTADGVELAGGAAILGELKIGAAGN